MLGVEEARHPQLGDGAARGPGLHAGERVAARGQCVGDLGDLVRRPDAGHRTLRGLVGVQRGLVVDPGLLVEIVTLDLAVQTLQLLPEVGDVLVGEPADPLELLLLIATGPHAGPPALRHEPTSASDQDDQQPLHGVSSASARTSQSLAAPRGCQGADVRSTA